MGSCDPCNERGGAAHYNCFAACRWRFAFGRFQRLCDLDMKARWDDSEQQPEKLVGTIGACLRSDFSCNFSRCV